MDSTGPTGQNGLESWGTTLLSAATISQLCRRGGSAVLDALLPPQCLSCRALVDRPGQLCPDCWSRIGFIADPVCACCGRPFDYDLGSGTLCGACVRVPPAYARARSVFRYDDASRPLLLGFKHADRTEAAPALGAWLRRAGSILLAEADLVAPVPLHRWRLLRRRYNQAALLAGALVRGTAVPAVMDLLERRRATPSQGGLSRAQRRRNVQGAFAVRDRHRDRARGRTVLLVDDVLTTGATAEACTRVLLQAGAARVDVLTLARVVREATDPI